MLVLTCWVLVLLCGEGGFALSMRRFEVPLHVPRGESTTLRCEFDLQGERLYSVKWYKGGREFFRHVPNEQPKKQVYEVTGVNVDMEESTGQVVKLREVELATSGRYKCEVLAEAPAFNTLVEHAILTVVEIPQEKPVVQGAWERYHPGDIVRINCTSAPSKPAATLTWYINDRVAPEQYLMRYLPYMDHEGLETTTLGLHFHATHDHFPRNVMSLRCTASIGFFYNKTEETALETHRPALSLQSREHFYDSLGARRTVSSLGLTLLLLCVLHALR
ncbi:cell adhesion molecule 2-like isoform X1 [Portunus trituberculatus]|uniref:cell adhesion molecule 2-like isoform X1 n=1 Tax=Portunus trituberculatus TaxID=210409 RepID=UPI001E1CD8C4|nr:cell adhesion molecule 2-like isoform X1 [Portunus trituberculatus]